jgi:hypothetical protein
MLGSSLATGNLVKLPIQRSTRINGAMRVDLVSLHLRVSAPLHQPQNVSLSARISGVIEGCGPIGSPD